MSAIGLLTRGYIDRLRTITLQVPQAPTQAQEMLVRSLELPLPPETTNVKGIHASDIIIRSAIVAAIADLRANPWLLDYVFASMPQDPLTWKEYGEKSLKEAKKWFLKTNIKVSLEPVMNELQLPAITIQLAESSEVAPESTLGDVNGEDVEEGNDQVWPALTPRFTPKSYSPATGIVVLNSAFTGVGIGAGMFIVDKVGRPHEILQVYDDTSFQISQGTVADLRDAVLKPHRPAYITHIESASFRETYRIGVHVTSEPQMLTWLHAITVFCLLRYKQALLEARGFERSTFSSSDFARDQQFETEIIFSRFISITGYVRQYWPKAVMPVIDAVVGGDLDDNAWIKVDGVRIEDGGVDPLTQLWTGTLDDEE